MKAVVGRQQVIYYNTAKSWFYCNCTFTVTDVASGAAIKNAYVTGKWTLNPDTPQSDSSNTYPLPVQGAVTTGAGATYMTTWIPAKGVFGATGTSCRFTITNVTMPGYALDRTASRLSTASAVL